MTKHYRVAITAVGYLDVESPDGTPKAALVLAERIVRQKGMQIAGKSLMNLTSVLSLVARTDTTPIAPESPKVGAVNLMVDDVIIDQKPDQLH
jgi:hypothetical protein